MDLPPGSNTIGYKWMFRRKYRTNRTIQTFKAMLVAKGFRQRKVHQMDVKTTFLHGNVDEEVYMDQSEGFVLSGNERKVCKLVKSLYGLKQALKQWHEKFNTVILANGFKYNGANKCVYSKFTIEYGVIVCLYVNDMLTFGINMKYLASMFK